MFKNNKSSIQDSLSTLNFKSTTFIFTIIFLTFVDSLCIHIICEMWFRFCSSYFGADFNNLEDLKLMCSCLGKMVNDQGY